MNDNYQRSDWYARPVYAPPQAAPRGPAQQPAPPAQQPPRRKNRAAKVLGIIACALLVLAGGLYAFADRFGLRLPGTGESGRRDYIIEVPGGGDKEEDAPEDYSKDYKDFFERYYVRQEQEERVPSEVARAATGDSFRVELQSAEGLTEGTLQTLYPECLQSIVSIRTYTKGQPRYYMGGGIIMSEDGYILTNQHLLSETNTAVVTLPDGRELNALLVGEDISTDLAVLKIEATGLHPAVFGDSDELTVGDSVFAIGNPILSSLKGTLTSGIVSGLSRSVSSSSQPMTLLQHTAPINEGSSGGALFNMYGQVVGVTNMKLSNPYSDVQVEGLCFAIPSATVKTVTDQLIADGHYIRPGIGITVAAISAEDAEHYGLPGGLYISAVSKTSDAAAKGVRPGDILIEANGAPVRETDDLMAIRDSLRVGDTLTLTLYRDGETFDVDIALVDYSTLY